MAAIQFAAAGYVIIAALTAVFVAAASAAALSLSHAAAGPGLRRRGMLCGMAGVVWPLIYLGAAQLVVVAAAARLLRDQRPGPTDVDGCDDRRPRVEIPDRRIMVIDLVDNGKAKEL